MLKLVNVELSNIDNNRTIISGTHVILPMKSVLQKTKLGSILEGKPMTYVVRVIQVEMSISSPRFFVKAANNSWIVDFKISS